MRTPSFQRSLLPTSVSSLTRLWGPPGPLVAAAAAMGLGFATVQAQTDDFNDGNDAGWQHTDLGSVGLPVTSYTFPSDGQGGLAYRIKAVAPPVPDAGPARSTSLLSQKYSRFLVGVDLLSWDATVDQAVGVFARVDQVGLGVTSGYVMNYNATDATLQINEVAQESPTTIAELDVTLRPAKQSYRFVFSGYEDNLLGQVFALPDTVNPVASVVARDTQHASGRSGLLVFSRADTEEYTLASSIADATFDNYSATAPAAGTLKATVVELSPSPVEIVRTIPAPVRVAVLNRETEASAADLTLSVDGRTIPGSELSVTEGVTVKGNTDPFPGFTAIYANAAVGSESGTHTNRVVLKDKAGNTSTHEWTYTYARLSASHAAPAGTGLSPGVNVRLVRAPSGGAALANSLARAEQQLATNAPASLAAFTTNAVVQTINFTQKNPADGGTDGSFAEDQSFPGIDPTVDSDPNDFAMEMLTYLELKAGVYTFGVVSDDGFQLRSGAGWSDPDALILGEQYSGTYNGTFDFIVPAAGLYPFRMVWFERGGGAHVELFQVDRSSGTRTLINAPDCPVKAFAALAVPSVAVETAVALGPNAFATDAGAVVDTVTKTVTLPVTAGQRFVRLKSNAALRIAECRLEGGKLVLRYE